MSAIPPKQMPDPSPTADDAHEAGGGLVAMYNAASHASAESFPVLKAFQEYIEAERAQARKRVMQLSIFFAVLMGVVVTGFLTAGIFMLRNMSTVQNKLLDVALTQRAAPAPAAAAAPAPVPAPAPAPVLQTSPVIEESVRQMSRAATELQASLDKKLGDVSDIASKVNEQVSSQNSELEKLRYELRTMQEQSSKIKDELVSVKKELSKKPPPAAPAPTPAAKPSLPAEKAVAAAPAEPRDPRFPPAVKEPPAAAAGATPPPAPQGLMATSIPLQTKNAGTVPWRVLLPE